MNLNTFEGFSKLSYAERRERLRQYAKLSDDELDTLAANTPDNPGLTFEDSEHLIENVIGVFQLPLGIATHFLIDEKETIVPMAVEETSVIAAASAAAKWVKRNGGFKTQAIGRLIIGQIQFPTVKDAVVFKRRIVEKTEALIAEANSVVPTLVARGGGVRDIQVRLLDRPDQQTMAVLHVLCDPCDAMGANLINQICEALKPSLEKLTGDKIGLCILSNLVDTKLFEATCEISDIDPELGKAIEEATLFANLDPYRAATHNKGVMNGIDPIVIATGNDWRAVEAGIHAYVASRHEKSYHTITQWKFENGKLKGRFCAPISVGTVGGVTKIHPTSKICLRILGVSRAEELARICAAVGLAQNLSALRALCSDGIIKGHMRLHAANLAIAAGASKEELPIVEALLRQQQRITLSTAKEVLERTRKNEIKNRTTLN
jgi:hydroxymethylglutaryl-CoA reductase